MRYRPAISIFIALVFALTLSCCGSGGGGGTLSVKLELPAGADPAIFSQDDRIVVRVYGPDFEQRQYEFARSSGKGSIEGIPEGEDRVIKVDEYDSGGNLIARGFSYGLRLTEGEDRSVSVVMIPKGWVITIAGGIGAGDSPDGTYAGDAQLNGPAEVEYYQGKIFISDLSNRNIKIIDEYFKVNKVGNITDISILSEGDSLLNTDIPFPVDFIVDDYIYCLSADLQIFSIDLFNVLRIYYTENPGIIFLNNGQNMFTGKNGQFYYSDYDEHKIYKIENGVKEIYIQRGANPTTIGEGIDKDNYGLLNPRGIYFDGTRLYFSDSGNNKVKFVENDLVFTLIGSYVENEFYDGILSSEYNIKNPDFIKSYGNFFIIRELDKENLLLIKENKLFLISNNISAPGSILQPLPPDSAGLVNPRDVTVDPDGNLYIADTGNNAIRMVLGGGL